MMRRFLGTLLSSMLASAAFGASVDGIELHSSDSGEGPTIVFVHGWTCDTSSWREQIPAFEERYRVVALDLPGHGRSESPAADDFSMDLFARAVEAVRGEIGAEEIVLVGHSMGTRVIRQYAITYPDRVAGLVAVDGALDLRNGPTELPFPIPMPLEWRESRIRQMFVPETAASLREHVLQMMLDAPEATAVGAARAAYDPSIRTLDVIDVPTLHISAGNNEPQDGETVRELFPNFEAIQVPGTGHFLMMEKPEEFNELIQEFLNGIDF